jgi:hypothetical protein
MPTNIRNVSFVNPLDPAGSAALQVQQQQIQRQQAIAQALQQQSMQEDKVEPGSRVSWTQGLAKLAQALAARDTYKKTDAQQVDLATKQGQAMQSMFGLGPKGPPQGDYAPNEPTSTPTDNISNTPPARGAYGSGGVEDDGSLPQAPQPAPQPQQAAPVAPQSRGPMSLSGNPMQDYVDYTGNPEEYTKALIQQHAPNDLAKTVAQARDAMSRGDIATAHALLANIEKQNNIPLVSGRPGAPMYDHNGNVVAMSPQNIEGANPTMENGHFTGGYTPAPGAAPIIQNVSAAKAFGGAAGSLTQRYNPQTQQMESIPTTQALSGGPVASGPPLGAQAAANVTGAADVPNRIYALHQMQDITNSPQAQFGVGSNGLNHFNSLLGTLSQSVHINFDPKAATNANEFQKWATQYSARSGQELGLSGSDARTQLAVHATPNGEMTRQALQSVIPQMIGIENAKQGYAQAANVWQKNNGPQSVQEFRTAWNKVYNPAIYTHMAQGPQSFAGWVKGLSKTDAAHVREQYVQLKQLGALPQ